VTSQKCGTASRSWWSALRRNEGQGANMFDHIGFKVDDVARSKAFYAAALAPFGM
jgi:hypothetical protein